MSKDLYTKFRNTGFVTSDQAVELERLAISYFESRTCENCKHNLKNRGLQKGCVIVEISPLDMVKDFGCNKFEAKG